MNKQEICNSINSIDNNTIFDRILQGGRGYSREDNITDLIRDNLNPDEGNYFETRQRLNDKVIDLIERNDNNIINCLEAKHYSPTQSKDLAYFLFESAGGPASDSLKLKKLGFPHHFLLQYTSQISNITGTPEQIMLLSNENEFKFLSYLFENGILIYEKINKPLRENWIGYLHDMFRQFFDDTTCLITRECNKRIDDNITISLLFHSFVMKVENNGKLINRYP